MSARTKPDTGINWNFLALGLVGSSALVLYTNPIDAMWPCGGTNIVMARVQEPASNAAMQSAVDLGGAASLRKAPLKGGREAKPSGGVLRVPVKSLQGFVVDEVIGEHTNHKILYVLGHFEDKEGRAIVKLEKSPINKDTLEALMVTPGGLKLDCVFHNDIFSKYVSSSAPDLLNAMTVELVYPATAKEINKFRSQGRVIIGETPEEYRRITQKHIESIPASRLQWVRNIIDGSAEASRVVGRDEHPVKGFVMIPDMKWDIRNDQEHKQLYCLAICNDPKVRSLRDLDTKHLPMLKRIRDRGCEMIEQKYGVPRHKLRVFVHYQPSYYHFHVHFTAVDADYGNASVGHAHLLDDIIENIDKMDGSFYKKKTLYMTLTENDPLYKRIYKLRNPGGGGGASDKDKP